MKLFTKKDKKGATTQEKKGSTKKTNGENTAKSTKPITTKELTAMCKEAMNTGKLTIKHHKEPEALVGFLSSSNDFQAIIPKLHTLDMLENSLFQFPTCSTTFQQLKNLNLSYNVFESFPDPVLSCFQLQRLNLAHNKLKTIPSEITQLTSLTSLNLSDNQLIKLPSSLRHFSGKGRAVFIDVQKNYLDYSTISPKTINVLSMYNDQHIPTEIIEKKLYLGSATAALNLEKLKENQITHILTVLEGFGEPKYKEHFTYMEIKIQDSEIEDIFVHLPQMVKFIDDALKEEEADKEEKGEQKSGRVLVHCAQGVSRSATAVIAYLMWKNNISAKEAIGMVKDKRKCIAPNNGFIRQLERYEKERVEKK